MIGQRTANSLWRIWQRSIQPNIEEGVRLLQAERYRWMQRLGMYSSDLASTHAAIPDVARRWLLHVSYLLRTKGAGVNRRKTSRKKTSQTASGSAARSVALLEQGSKPRKTGATRSSKERTSSQARGEQTKPGRATKSADSSKIKRAVRKK